jgi:hypothetical protein
VERSDVEYEVLSARNLILGLKKIPAKIKVILTDEYLFKFSPKEERRKPEQKPQQKQESRRRPLRRKGIPPRAEAGPAGRAGSGSRGIHEQKPQQKQERTQPAPAQPERRIERDRNARRPPSSRLSPETIRPENPLRDRRRTDAAEVDPDAAPTREEPKELSPEVLEQKGSASSAYLKEFWRFRLPRYGDHLCPERRHDRPSASR